MNINGDAKVASFSNRSKHTRDLDERFTELLDKNSATGLAFWSLVRENLQRFNLTGSHFEAYVINEVYIRTVKVYEKEEKIDNLLAWCCKTAYNYDRVYNFASIIPPKLI